MEIAGPVVACVADLAFKYAGVINLHTNSATHPDRIQEKLVYVRILTVAKKGCFVLRPFPC